MRRARATAVIATALCAGCYTGVDVAALGDTPPTRDPGAEDPSGEPDDSSDDADPDAPPPATCDGEALTVSEGPVRRLTATQYRNVITDLLELGEGTEDALAGLDAILGGRAGAFAANVVPVDTQTARSYLLLAEDLADAYVADALPQALPCDWADPACATTFLADFGRRAYRRPLTDDSAAALLELHATQLAAEDAPTAMRAVVAAMLSSPAFIYHAEPVAPAEDGAQTVALDSWAFASRLAFLIWNSGPDDQLLDAAEAGNLVSTQEVRAQVDRMLEDDRFDRTLEAFYPQWLGIQFLDNLTSQDPSFNPAAMGEETRRFVNDLYRDGDGTLAGLLTGSHTFVDADLAAIYGVEAPAEPFARVDLDPSERSGILTHASVLAVTGSTAFPVIFRGKFVNERLLCNELPVPDDIELDGSVDRQATQPCAGCHTLMDPIGEGFARYNALGRYAETDEAGATIAQTGRIAGGDTFDGPRGLAELLLADPRTHACIAASWAEYATRRVSDGEDDCAMDELGAALDENDGDLRRLIQDVATSAWLRSRSRKETE